MPHQVRRRGDLFVIAATELGISAERLLREIRLDGLEESDGLGPVEAAACRGAWIILHQPFPRRNLEIGYRYMRLMLREAPARWPRPEEDADRIERMLRLLEAKLISEARFAEWVCLRVATA
jgi:hypothetical protein